MAGVHEDEKCFKSLLTHLGEVGARIRMATGYLNLMKPIKKLLEKVDTELLVASPKANSFYKAGFVKKHIPALYRLNAI